MMVALSMYNLLYAMYVVMDFATEHGTEVMRLIFREDLRPSDALLSPVSPSALFRVPSHFAPLFCLQLLTQELNASLVLQVYVSV